MEELAIQYFSDGVHIEQGTGHSLYSVINERICDDAIDTPPVQVAPCPPSTSPSAALSSIRLRGWTLADYAPGKFWCLDSANMMSPCGLDKGLQLDGGTVSVQNSEFLGVRTPVRVCSIEDAPECGAGLCPHGPHTISFSLFNGRAQTGCPPYQVGLGNPDFCTSADDTDPDGAGPFVYSDECRNASVGLKLGNSGSRTSLIGNKIMYGKWGIRVEAGADVDVIGNTIKTNYGAGIAVSDTGASVLVQNTAFSLNGCNGSIQGGALGPQHGGHVVIAKLGFGNEAPPGTRPTTPSRIDLGGGDKTRKDVFSGITCGTGLAYCSTGGNVFCRDPNRKAGTIPDEEEVRNTTNFLSGGGIATSVGIGGGSNPSCVGEVGSTVPVTGRALAQSDPDGSRGTRCTNTNLTGNSSPQNCAIDSASTCNCTTYGPE